MPCTMPHHARILYAAPDPVPFPKGSATRIEATVRALTAAGARVVLLTPHAGGGMPPPSSRAGETVPPEAERIPRLEGIPGLTHHPVSIGGGTVNFLDRMLAFREAVATWMRSEPWDLIWFRSPWEGVAALREGRQRGGRLVYEAHGFPSVELPFHYPRLLSHPALLDKLIDEEAMLLGGADLVITPSATGRTYLRARGVPSPRIRVVPNSAEAVPAAEASEPLPSPPWQLLYVGTLAPWQGLGTLIEAMALARGAPDMRLRVVGTLKGPWLRELRSLASGLRVRERVELVGPVSREQLPALYAQAHVCVAPLPDDARNSMQGCCPIKILEYMASARPILATRVRPVEEILEHGRTGWLVGPGSPWALLSGLRWMTSHAEAAEEMGLRARAEVERSWNRGLFHARVEDVLRELTASGSLFDQRPRTLAHTSS